MSPDDYGSLVATVGPVMALIIWLYSEHRKSLREAPPPDHRNSKTEKLEEAVADLDKRVAVIEAVQKERSKR